jgi:hypothetical protein
MVPCLFHLIATNNILLNTNITAADENLLKTSSGVCFVLTLSISDKATFNPHFSNNSLYSSAVSSKNQGSLKCVKMSKGFCEVMREQSSLNIWVGIGHLLISVSLSIVFFGVTPSSTFCATYLKESPRL